MPSPQLLQNKLPSMQSGVNNMVSGIHNRLELPRPCKVKQNRSDRNWSQNVSPEPKVSNFWIRTKSRVPDSMFIGPRYPDAEVILSSQDHAEQARRFQCRVVSHNQESRVWGCAMLHGPGISLEMPNPKSPPNQESGV